LGNCQVDVKGDSYRGYRDVLIMFLFNNMMLKLFNARWVLDID